MTNIAYNVPSISSFLAFTEAFTEESFVKPLKILAKKFDFWLTCCPTVCKFAKNECVHRCFSSVFFSP